MSPLFLYNCWYVLKHSDYNFTVHDLHFDFGGIAQELLFVLSVLKFHHDAVPNESILIYCVGHSADLFNLEMYGFQFWEKLMKYLLVSSQAFLLYALSRVFIMQLLGFLEQSVNFLHFFNFFFLFLEICPTLFSNLSTKMFIFPMKQSQAKFFEEIEIVPILKRESNGKKNVS